MQGIVGWARTASTSCVAIAEVLETAVHKRTTVVVARISQNTLMVGKVGWTLLSYRSINWSFEAFHSENLKCTRTAAISPRFQPYNTLGKTSLSEPQLYCYMSLLIHYSYSYNILLHDSTCPGLLLACV